MKNGRYTDIVLSPILFLVSYQGSFISGKISVFSIFLKMLESKVFIWIIENQI